MKLFHPEDLGIYISIEDKASNQRIKRFFTSDTYAERSETVIACKQYRWVHKAKLPIFLIEVGFIGVGLEYFLIFIYNYDLSQWRSCFQI